MPEVEQGQPCDSRLAYSSAVNITKSSIRVHNSVFKVQHFLHLLLALRTLLANLANMWMRAAFLVLRCWCPSTTFTNTSAAMPKVNLQQMNRALWMRHTYRVMALKHT
jgi:hypothetical protein